MISTIYCDFDGTIVNTIEAIVSLYNEDFKYYKKFHKVNWTDIKTWEFTECNCSTPEYIDTYFNQERFFNALKFMDNAEDILNKLNNKYKIVIVSMGYSPNLYGKNIWIKQHLPFADFIGVNFKSHDDKSHIDMSDGIYIDDNMKNLQTNAIENICFGENYQWNKAWTGKRCVTWEELDQYIEYIERR